MKQNRLLIAGSVLAAAWMTTGTAMAQSAGSGSSSGSAQSTKEVHPSVNTSKGQSKSERADETGTPLPQGSPYAGTVEKGKSSSANSGMDTSTSARGTSSSGRMARGGSAANVKEAQQALKDKGYDPGPVDGVMGTKTKDAIKSFQSASNLQATGTLDAQTADKLGVHSGSSSSRSSASSSSDNMKSSNTTTGKDTDQPNQTPSKNR